MSDETKMSAEFLEENREAIDEALFNQIVNPPDQPPSIGQGLSELGSGIAWAAFWLALGLLLSAMVWKGPA